MAVPMDASALELKTSRCSLRPISGADLARLHEMWTSPGVRRFLWDDEIIPLSEARLALERSEQLFRDRAHGLWGLWLPDPPALIGFAGLWPFRDPPQLELVYGLAESHWGQGYATEAARAIVAYCFASLDMPVVCASTDAGNAASIRVLDRLGFHFERRATVGGLDTVFYELDRDGAPMARGVL
jgi:ribosomal-protein-alanine N-acetyltransferase